MMEDLVPYSAVLNMSKLAVNTTATLVPTLKNVVWTARATEG